VLTSPFQSSGGTAYAQGQGAVSGTSFTNPTNYTYTGLVFQVELVHGYNQAPSQLPTLLWSWDGSPWQPIAHLVALPGDSPPRWGSDPMPAGGFAPGSTHVVRFWLAFGAGETLDGYYINVNIEDPRCHLGAVGYSPGIFFTLYTSVSGGSPTTPPVPPSAAPSPVAPPAQTADPVPATLAAPVAALAPARPAERPATGPGPVLDVAVAVVFAGLAVRMGLRWWSAGRRLP
jgi:hypothetical protein